MPSTATQHYCPWEIESSNNGVLSNGGNGAGGSLEHLRNILMNDIGEHGIHGSKVM